MDIGGSNELPLMNLRYNIFMGGVPEETRLVSGSVASDAPFIGCIRDVLVKSPSVVTDFNAAPYHTGVQLGTCITSAAKGKVFVYFQKWPEPGLFLFIFILFSLQFQ